MEIKPHPNHRAFDASIRPGRYYSYEATLGIFPVNLQADCRLYTFNNGNSNTKATSNQQYYYDLDTTTK